MNQRKSAWKSTVESDVKNASLAIETATTENNGTTPAVGGEYSEGSHDLIDSAKKTYGKITVTKDNTLTITVTGNSYEIKVTNSNVTGDGSVCTYSYDTGSISWGNPTKG